MLINLFVHGSFYAAVEVRHEGLPFLMVPTYGPPLPAELLGAALPVSGVLHVARGEPVPHTAETIWECTDPQVALRDGKLIWVGEGA